MHGQCLGGHDRKRLKVFYCTQRLELKRGFTQNQRSLCGEFCAVQGVHGKAQEEIAITDVENGEKGRVSDLKSRS